MFKHKLLQTIAIFCFSVVSITSSYANLIVFGDSLSDVGNNQWVEINGKAGAPFTNENDKGERKIWLHELSNQFDPEKNIYPSGGSHSSFVCPRFN